MFASAFGQPRESRQRPVSGQYVRVDYSGGVEFYARRACGLGSCWTTLHLAYEREIAEILQISFAQAAQIAMIPVTYSLETEFTSGPRKPLSDVMHLDL
jgi:nitroreductase